jgi:hypothetical protein
VLAVQNAIGGCYQQDEIKPKLNHQALLAVPRYCQMTQVGRTSDRVRHGAFGRSCCETTDYVLAFPHIQVLEFCNETIVFVVRYQRFTCRMRISPAKRNRKSDIFARS